MKLVVLALALVAVVAAKDLRRRPKPRQGSFSGGGATAGGGGAYGNFGLENPEIYADLLDDIERHLLREQVDFTQVATNADDATLAELELISDPAYLRSLTGGYGIGNDIAPPPGWGPNADLLAPPREFRENTEYRTPPRGFAPNIPSDFVPNFGSSGGSSGNYGRR